jgi:hypothetical protein
MCRKKVVIPSPLDIELNKNGIPKTYLFQHRLLLNSPQLLEVASMLSSQFESIDGKLKSTNNEGENTDGNS